MGFRYAKDWVKNGGFAISQQLPLTTEEFPAEAGGAVQHFFANLLPQIRPSTFKTCSGGRYSMCYPATQMGTQRNFPCCTH
jgi:hypothetical protein